MIDIFTKRRYVRSHGEQCFHCESYAVQPGDYRLGNNYVYVEVHCLFCWKEWTDIFKFSGWKDGKGKKRKRESRSEVCPYCESKEGNNVVVSLNEGDFKLNEDEGVVLVSCDLCEGQWTEIYELSDVEEAELSKVELDT